MTDSLAPFTPSAQAALDAAERVAVQYAQTVISPEHLLLGLLRARDATTESFLRSHGADPGALELELERSLERARNELLRTSPQGMPQPGAVLTLAEDTRVVLREASREAQAERQAFVDPRVLLLGMMRVPYLAVTRLLGEYGLELGTARAALAPIDFKAIAAQAAAPPASRVPPIQISPVFGALVAFTAAAGLGTYTGLLPGGLGVFLFILGGWIVSLCLHEFGHALVAYIGGDSSVAHQGYLTLNPLRYTHGVLSILLPLVFLAMGGIGLPGGAVYINRGAIRSRAMQSLVSLAGPAASALCALVLVLPFLFGVSITSGHLSFWSAVAALAFLQVTAVLFNLLPLPPLDGFGAIEPYLPDALLRVMGVVRQYGFLILMFLFIYDTPVSQGLGQSLGLVMRTIGLPGNLVGRGLELFRFWQ